MAGRLDTLPAFVKLILRDAAFTGPRRALVRFSAPSSPSVAAAADEEEAMTMSAAGATSCSWCWANLRRATKIIKQMSTLPFLYCYLHPRTPLSPDSNDAY